MYQVGTICIGQNIVCAPHFNGMECEITGELKHRVSKAYDTKEPTETIAYEVKWINGEITYTRPSQLRPKHIPGSWDELEKTIGWRPGVTV